MIENAELGYTPNNLKAIRQKHGLTQQAAADLIGTNIATLQRWETGIERKSHADMPYTKWIQLINYLNAPTTRAKG